MRAYSSYALVRAVHSAQLHSELVQVDLVLLGSLVDAVLRDRLRGESERERAESVFERFTVGFLLVQRLKPANNNNNN